MGGYVVGFEASQGGVLEGLKPIFMTASGLRDGEPRGRSGSIRILAKDGYAVGGLVVRSASVVDSVQVVFMRINPDGVSLNPQDAYVSDPVGGRGGNAAKEVSARGRLVVGVIGGTGEWVESIGLVYLK
jgi:hypothetical protein